MSLFCTVGEIYPDIGQNRRFNLPHLYLAPPSGVNPSEFRRDLWHQKLEGLPFHVVGL